ncbi:metallophosphoesterase [Sphingobacterium chungjuense]|uniref:metallophosphoesterase n=1 Tax=Sphingobacterium chungjuense TaxID=2675553 RepID=UPI00140C0064|nr:metallophosphoesterase [Sphingobacterium chungjuense]
MIQYLFLIMALASSLSYAQTSSLAVSSTLAQDSIQELPHLFFNADDTLIRWVKDGALQQISSTETPDFRKDVAQLAATFDLPLLAALKENEAYSNLSDRSYEYSDVPNWLAISDIHGQYPLFVALLQQHQVIDSKGNWIFGEGHLVINGDIFDRGTGVTEALWHTYKLQQQALSAGGKVHYLIGNHELMVLDNDLRYVHDQYKLIAEILDKPYEKQFGRQSFFGQWIRQQPITIKINDTWFVHAGISPEIVQENLTPKKINSLFRDSIFTQLRADYRANPTLNLLATSNGPVWYRGYFKDETINQGNIKRILQFWNADRMVIGHTSQKQITPLFENKVIVIDSSIKNGKTGEVLIYNEGQLFRGLLNGSRLAL